VFCLRVIQYTNVKLGELEYLHSNVVRVVKINFRR
jgi:hypothetical protein